ncbi:MAG: ribosomal protein S18-alanine N-acetyltransferase [Labilithrix sp.]|nr:ribosomal protein S18-alanine N-acetyltransferase [Labilithrix sp.]MCW5810556.1 ribosomal protein S18-alanine N-acetyltransferase [Labilithrix sp.]
MILPMSEADVAAVLAIDPDVREGQLREELTRAWARLRVDRAGGDVLGYVLFWHVTDEIHLLNVAVDPRARRQGRGRALVEEVVGYARANAAAKVLLEVRRSNEPALALYRSLGFEEINVRRRYYDDGEDAIEMMLALIR